MSEQRGFVSCFRIDRRPILPPVMTPKRRIEMQEYKLKALAVEQRLKERKLLNEKSKISKNEKESHEENKENGEKILRKGSNKNLLNMANVMEESAKSSLSERCLKEVPLQCNPTEPKLASLICQEPMPPFDDLDYLEDGMCSVTPTESTDLQPYLDSTLEDVSPEVGSNFDCQESMQFKKRCPYFVTGHENSNSVDTSLSSSKVSTLESKFVDVNFSPLVNLEKSTTELFSTDKLEKNSNKFEEVVDNIVGELAPAFMSLKHDYPCLRNPEAEDKLLKSNLNVDCLNFRTSLRSEPAGTELCDVTYTSEKLHAGMKHTNIPTDTLEGVHVLPSHSSSDSTNTDSVGAISTSASERNDRENSPLCSPPRLVRRGSYTLDSPSPILCANLDQFKVDTLPPSNSSNTIANLTKDVVIIAPASKDCAAILETVAVGNKNTDVTSDCGSKDLMESVKNCHQVDTKASVTAAKGGRCKMPCKKQLPQGQIKIPSTKSSVFERLAADGAKKAEERRKWTKESIFKVPGVKKVPKAAKSQLRTAVSASNIRMTLTEVHRKRSGSLASMRCNSDVNIVCGQSGNLPLRKQNNAALPLNMHKKEKVAKLQKGKSFDGNYRVNAPKGSANPDNLQRSHSVDMQENKESTSNSAQHDSPVSPKKQMYIVQTSPISPPCTNPLIDDTADVDSAAAQRRRRRRWSANWDGWTNLAESNCSTLPCDKNPPKIAESSKNIENSEILEKKIMASIDGIVFNSERKELCPGMCVNMFALPKHGHQDTKLVKSSESNEEHFELCSDEIVKVITAVEVIKKQEKGTAVKEVIKKQEKETAVKEDIKTQEKGTAVKEDIKTQEKGTAVKEDIKTQEKGTAVKEDIKTQEKGTAVKEDIKKQEKETAVKEDIKTQEKGTAVKEDIKTQEKGTAVKEDIKTQEKGTAVKEDIKIQEKETAVKEVIKKQEKETTLEDIKTQENSRNKEMNLSGQNNFPEHDKGREKLSERKMSVITVSVCEVKNGLNEEYVNFPSPPEVTQCLQEPVEEITSHASNVSSDLLQNYKKVDFAVENYASSNLSQASSVYSPSSKIPCDLQYSIATLPETPLGPHGAKDMAFRLLRRLVEEQEKAMSQLLEEQRLQAENMQKKFKEQQKYLVGRLARLVNNLPSPQNNEAIGSGQVSEWNASTPLIETEVNQSGVIHNNDKYIDTAISTPVHIFREIAETNEYHGVSSVSDMPCSVSPLSPSNFIDPSSISGTRNKISETREICDNVLINTSDHEDFHRIICSLCQVCHSPSNTCKCSSVDGSYSSTLKEECTTVDINASEHITITSKLGNGKMKDLNGEERTVFQVSPSLINDNNQSIRASRSRDSNSCDMFKGMESSTMIEGSSVQNVDLDLSGILEMESREKNLSLSTKPLLAINVLQDACSSGVSSVNQPKIQMTNEEVMNEVSLHQQKYEEDLWRLAAIETHSINAKELTKGSNYCIVKAIPLITKGINLTSIEDCPISQRKISAMEDQEDKCEIQTYMQTELPDLRSDVVALRTYLGAQTPSTGPVTLETPISTPRYQCSENIASHLISGELADKAKNNLSPESSKEKVSSKDDAMCPVALETPILISRYQSSESIVSHLISEELLADRAESSMGNISRKEDARFPELQLMIEESENEKKYEYHSEEYQLPIRSPSSTTGSSSERQRFTSDDSPSSGQYTTASSNSRNKSLVLRANDSEILKKFSKLSAFVKGYLTRRLLKTVKVLNIKATIQDSLMTALKLHSEVSADEELNPADVLLHGQILAQLTAACHELHHVCFGLSVAQQMAIINADRQRLLSRTSTPIFYDADGPITPRPALLSAVTLKTLQRRFGNELSIKKGVAANFKSKPKAVKEYSKVTVNSLPEGGSRPTRSRARSIHLSSYADVGKGTMSGIRKQFVGKGTEIRTSNVWVKPNDSKRKPRRSSSAGEINRKPWR